jgi:hypothetical protein
MFAVDDIDVIARLLTYGAELVGEVAQYEDSYRLCYVRPRLTRIHPTQLPIIFGPFRARFVRF